MYGVVSWGRQEQNPGATASFSPRAVNWHLASDALHLPALGHLLATILRLMARDASSISNSGRHTFMSSL